jgi:hypothetical protein
MLRARFPSISVDGGRFLLMNLGNDPLPSLAGLCVSGARLNLLQADRRPGHDPAQRRSPTWRWRHRGVELAARWSGRPPATTASVAPPEYDMRYGRPPRSSTRPAGMPPRRWRARPNPRCRHAETMRVNALSASTTYYFGVRAKDEYGNLGDFSNSPAGRHAGPADDRRRAFLAVGRAADRRRRDADADRSPTRGVGVLDFTIPTPSYIIPAKADRSRRQAVRLRRTGQGRGRPARGYQRLRRTRRVRVQLDRQRQPRRPGLQLDRHHRPGHAGDPDRRLEPGSVQPGLRRFPFYGVDYTTFRIGTNGFVSFTSAATSRMPTRPCLRPAPRWRPGGPVLGRPAAHRAAPATTTMTAPG